MNTKKLTRAERDSLIRVRGAINDAQNTAYWAGGNITSCALGVLPYCEVSRAAFAFSQLQYELDSLKDLVNGKLSDA